MSKLWAGRTSGITDKIADDFNSSISFDSRMYREDIEGSMAHAAMLAKCDILSAEDAAGLIAGLKSVLEDIESGKLEIDPLAEDIHMFVEQVLTQRLGALGKKLHTARSRNDQVALDMRLYLRKECDNISDLLKAFATVLTDKAEECKDMILPGYTHMQRAQPIVFGHQLLCYAMMFLRDMDRLADCRKRIDVSPIGACAFAGTTYPTDRDYEASLLGIDQVCLNSIDGVSDRDFCLEFLSVLSISMMHLSRLAEEILLWTSWEFGFVRLDDAYTTGSSIMPQKKNSDMAELVRGKTGRVYGSLMALLTTMKGLPLAYNKDMQEDKEGVFDAIDTIKMCLNVFTPMVATMTPRPERMLKAAQEGFINATDLADYMTKKGVPFRDAYKISGAIVSECIDEGLVLETYPLDRYKAKCDIIEKDIYSEISLTTCVSRRISKGGTGPESVRQQIAYMREKLK